MHDIIFTLKSNTFIDIHDIGFIFLLYLNHMQKMKLYTNIYYLFHYSKHHFLSFTIHSSLH